MIRLALALVLFAGPVWAQATGPSGCALGGTYAAQNIPVLHSCLSPSVPKSDFENFALASAGPIIWPGNASAIANSRAWDTVVIDDFLGSDGGVTIAGTPNHYAQWHLTVNDNYSGGTSGYVNAGLRVDTNVGAEATDFPWGILSVINTSSPTSQPASIYGQANNSGSGVGFAGVFEAHSTAGGTAVGVEADAGCTAGGNCVAFDAVQPAGQSLTAAYRAPCNVKALVSPNDSSSYIIFPCAGGVEIIAHGKTVASW